MNEQERRAKATHEAAIRMARAATTAKDRTIRETAVARLIELEASYAVKYGEI
jgi:hypothetical protein